MSTPYRQSLIKDVVIETEFATGEVARIYDELFESSATFRHTQKALRMKMLMDACFKRGLTSFLSPAELETSGYVAEQLVYCLGCKTQMSNEAYLRTGHIMECLPKMAAMPRTPANEAS